MFYTHLSIVALPKEQLLGLGTTCNFDLIPKSCGDVNMVCKNTR